MKYVKTIWMHGSDDEPSTMYSVIDEDRHEIEKIEIFKNGKWGYADQSIEIGDTRLGETPIPELGCINSLSGPDGSAEFSASYISKDEYDEVKARTLTPRQY